MSAGLGNGMAGNCVLDEPQMPELAENGPAEIGWCSRNSIEDEQDSSYPVDGQVSALSAPGRGNCENLV